MDGKIGVIERSNGKRLSQRLFLGKGEMDEKNKKHRNICKNALEQYEFDINDEKVTTRMRKKT